MAERTLLAVLDWGLGHASRAVPLLRKLQADGDRVWVASAGPALQLLAEECPEVARYELPAYAVRYPTSSMPLNLCLQGPRLLGVLARERRRAAQLVRELRPTRIVSDGRFAFYDHRVPSIWLAHQLQIQYKYPRAKRLLNHFYHAHLRRHFAEVWVPDLSDPQRSLAGALAQPIEGLPHHYLGPLSRYAVGLEETAVRYDWLCLLSGPEPARSRLEAQVRERFAGAQTRVLLVRGCPGSNHIQQEQAYFQVVDWLHGQDLARAVAASGRVLCRSGYSTLMDLYYWQKPAVLVPTPGQTEQEYLAQYWAKKGLGTNKIVCLGNL